MQAFEKKVNLYIAADLETDLHTMCIFVGKYDSWNSLWTIIIIQLLHWC